MRRFLLFVCLVLGFSALVEAQGKAQGFCENGGTSVIIPGTQGSGNQKFQQTFPSCTVTVYAPGTTNLSTIYSDTASTPKANPFTAAANGQWFFYAGNGSYDVKFSGGGIPAPFTLSAVNVGIATSVDCSSFTGATASIKITACANGLPATGGRADAGNIIGTQTWTTDAFTGITKPIDFTCGAATYTVSATSTIPTNVHLIATDGCIFSVNAGITLNINGSMDGSSTSLHFSGSGGVAFISGAKIPAVPIEWFGGVADWNGSTGTDNGPAMLRAANAVKGTITPGEVRSTNVGVPPITFISGSYTIATQVDLPNWQYVKFKGAGPQSTFLVENPSSVLDMITFRSLDGNYRSGNGFSDMSIVPNNANVRKAVWASEQDSFLVSNVWFQPTAGGLNVAATTALLYLDGMIRSQIYNSRFNFAAGDGLVFGVENSSTTSACVNCSFDSNTGAGFNVYKASTISFDHAETEANAYGARCSNGASIAITASHFEANTVNAIYDNNAVNQCTIASTGNTYIGRANGSDTLFNFDDVLFRSQGDQMLSAYTYYATTANTIVQQLTDSIDRSFGFISVTGSGKFETSGMPFPVLKFSDEGNFNSSQIVQVSHGGVYKITLTGNANVHFSNTNQGWPIGFTVSLYMVQDATGGRTVVFDSSNGGDFPFKTSYADAGNTANKVSTLTFFWDGTRLVQLAYSPWF